MKIHLFLARFHLIRLITISVGFTYFFVMYLYLIIASFYKSFFFENPNDASRATVSISYLLETKFHPNLYLGSHKIFYLQH